MNNLVDAGTELRGTIIEKLKLPYEKQPAKKHSFFVSSEVVKKCCDEIGSPCFSGNCFKPSSCPQIKLDLFLAKDPSLLFLPWLNRNPIHPGLTISFSRDEEKYRRMYEVRLRPKEMPECLDLGNRNKDRSFFLTLELSTLGWLIREARDPDADRMLLERSAMVA